MINQRTMLIFSAISGFIYVALGAFGAHVLKFRLTENEFEWLETGLQYQIVHTLVLLLVGFFLIGRSKIERWYSHCGLFLLLGILLFSGSLYGLALTGVKGMAYLTPIGGACFLFGWLCLLVGVLTGKTGIAINE